MTIQRERPHRAVICQRLGKTRYRLLSRGLFFFSLTTSATSQIHANRCCTLRLLIGETFKSLRRYPDTFVASTEDILLTFERDYKQQHLPCGRDKSTHELFCFNTPPFKQTHHPALTSENSHLSSENCFLSRRISALISLKHFFRRYNNPDNCSSLLRALCLFSLGFCEHFWLPSLLPARIYLKTVLIPFSYLCFQSLD